MSAPTFRTLAQGLHTAAVGAAGASALPAELARALGEWRPGAGDQPLRVGVLGMGGTGKTTLVQALGLTSESGQRRVGLPPGLQLLDGPTLEPGGPTLALLEWVASLDAAILLHPLRVALAPAERRLLSGLTSLGIPCQLGLAQADLEQPLREGGRTHLTAGTRLAKNMAELAAELGDDGSWPVPVWVGEPGVDGLVGLVGRLWGWAEQRETLVAARDLRHLARLLEAIAAATLPLPAWAMGQAYRPAEQEGPGSFRALATEAWGALTRHKPEEDPAAGALVGLLAVFAESEFRARFAEALPPGEVVLLAGPRDSSLRMLALLHHDFAQARMWEALAPETWLVCGQRPAGVPADACLQLDAAIEHRSLVIPPAGQGLESADVLVVEQDPRQPPYPHAHLHTWPHAATIPPAELARRARAADDTPFFLYDGYDARFTQLWALARAGEPILPAWQEAGLSLAEPLTRTALEAV